MRTCFMPIILRTRGSVLVKIVRYYKRHELTATQIQVEHDGNDNKEKYCNNSDLDFFTWWCRGTPHQATQVLSHKKGSLSHRFMDETYKSTDDPFHTNILFVPHVICWDLIILSWFVLAATPFWKLVAYYYQCLLQNSILFCSCYSGIGCEEQKVLIPRNLQDL